MKTSFPWKQTLALFAAVLLAYLAVFNGIEWLRHRKGSWQVRFLTDSSGAPAVEISQRYHKIVFRTHFHGERVVLTNYSELVAFDKPKKKVPFGKVIYEDLTFLPGVVTFDFFGHEVELLPRVLIANKKEIRWDTGQLALGITNKPPVPPKPAKGYGY